MTLEEMREKVIGLLTNNHGLTLKQATNIIDYNSETLQRQRLTQFLKDYDETWRLV